jgi:hypothetical protein
LTSRRTWSATAYDASLKSPACPCISRVPVSDGILAVATDTTDQPPVAYELMAFSSFSGSNLPPKKRSFCVNTLYSFTPISFSFCCARSATARNFNLFITVRAVHEHSRAARLNGEILFTARVVESDVHSKGRGIVDAALQNNRNCRNRECFPRHCAGSFNFVVAIWRAKEADSQSP